MNKSKEVVVDGTNVVMHAGEPQLKNIDFVLEKLCSMDYQPTVFFDASTRYKFSEVGELEPKLRRDLTELSEEWHKLDSEREEKARSIGDKVYKLVRVNVETELLPGNEANLWVKESKISRVIGQDGKNIKKVEKETDTRINVREKADKPSGDFTPETSLFKKINGKIGGETGHGVTKDAVLYRTDCRVKNGKKREIKWYGWKIVDDDRTYKIRYRIDQEGKEHLAIHDLQCPSLERYEDFLDSSKNFMEVSPGVDADRWILDRAEKSSDPLVVSNDSFEDYKKKYSFIDDPVHHLKFTIADEEAEIVGLEEALPKGSEPEEERYKKERARYDLTDEAGKKILPLINRAEDKLTVYSPFISPKYAKKLVEKAEDGVNITVNTAPSNAHDFQERSIRILRKKHDPVVSNNKSITLEGAAVLSFCVGALLAMVAYAAYEPAAILSVLSFGGAAYLLWRERSLKDGPSGEIVVNVLDNLHAKLFSRDEGEEVIFGSANFTKSGLFHNLEVINKIAEKGGEE